MSCRHIAGKVRLTYVDRSGASDALVQRCGACDLEAERDLEAWVIDQAAPWDLINTDRGSFVREVMPGGLGV